MYRPVVCYMNAAVVERPAGPVTEFGTAELRELVDDMFETMYEAHGVGLAAPQVAISKRVAVIDVAGADEDKTPEKIVLVNPQVISKTGKQTGEEGCLSIPGFREPVTRAKVATIRAQDVEGHWFEITGEDLLARALLHEIDHLDGILF